MVSHGLPPVVQFVLSAIFERYACSKMVRRLHSSGCTPAYTRFLGRRSAPKPVCRGRWSYTAFRVPVPRSVVRSVDRGTVAREAADC